MTLNFPAPLSYLSVIHCSLNHLFHHWDGWAYLEKSHTAIWVNVLQIHGFLYKLDPQEHQAMLLFVPVLYPVSYSGYTICLCTLYDPIPSALLVIKKILFRHLLCVLVDRKSIKKRFLPISCSNPLGRQRTRIGNNKTMLWALWSRYEGLCCGNRCKVLPTQMGAGRWGREVFLEEEASKLGLEGLIRISQGKKEGKQAGPSNEEIIRGISEAGRFRELKKCDVGCSGHRGIVVRDGTGEGRRHWQEGLVYCDPRAHGLSGGMECSIAQEGHDRMRSEFSKQLCF